MKASFAIVVLGLLALSAFVNADTYLHNPRGSNNRLDEANRDRNNGNRMFDSQNNNRGGVNRGTFGREYFYEGSSIRVEWTSQHSCANPNNNCDIILQYYCDDTNVTRDGLTTTTIPDIQDQQDDCLQANCDLDYRYGRHESFYSYQMCKYRSRNRGLYTSTQDMSNGRNGAIFTRQNNNGDRHGYECPEERDYYPYWHPNEWRDIAIITNDTSRCSAWQAESQNVKSRWFCVVPQSYIDSMVGTDPANMNQRYGFIPITQAGCEAAAVGGTWTERQAHNIPAPQCVQSQWQRDNHLGNTFGGETPHWEWTIPAHTLGVACIFRLRYNISTSETRQGGEWASPTSVQCGALNSSMNYKPNSVNTINIDQNNNDPTPTNPRFFKYADQLDVWSRYGLSRADSLRSFTVAGFYDDDNYGPTTRGYVFRNDPVVDIFGTLAAGGLVPASLVAQPACCSPPNIGQAPCNAINDNADTTCTTLPGALLPLRLSLDTSQYSRTFEDRTHVFSIRRRPAILQGLSAGHIWNVGVRGKRGNIVQVYPSVEYDFVPNQLTVAQGDWLHFQWQGSNTNPGNNAGQGTAGTDRSNIVVLRAYGKQWAPQEFANLHGPFSGVDENGAAVTHISNWKLSYPSRIDAAGIDFLGLSVDKKRKLALGGVYSPYFDLAPVQVRSAGVFNYLCTRNNAFTNRGEKAQITVTPVTNADALFTNTEASEARFISASGASWIRFAPDPIGITTNSPLNIEELEDGRILVTPFLFDVVPGQSVMLDMTYTEKPFTDVYIYQSDYVNYNGNDMGALAANGVATTKITRGGYYHIEQQVAASSVAGVVIGTVAFAGLLGFGYYRLKKKFHIRDKKYMAAATST